MAVSQSKNKYINSVFENTQTNIITITEDKLVNKLTSYTTKVKKSNEWIGTLGILISLVLALITSSFKDTLGISGNAWFHLFLFVAFLVFLYFCYCLYNVIKNSTSIQDVINDIKSS